MNLPFLVLTIKTDINKRCWTSYFATKSKIMAATLNITMVFVLLGTLWAPFCSGNPSPPAAGPYSSTEQWVLDQITIGQVANVGEAFKTDVTKQVISSRFLEDILTGTSSRAQIHRNGVRIVGAIFDEPVQLTNAEIVNEVALNSCHFKAPFTCERASFLRDVTFASTIFDEDVDFQGIRAESNVNLENTVFNQGLNFSIAAIGQDLNAPYVHFANKEKQVNLTRMKVGGKASFSKAVFDGPANFFLSSFTSSFEACDSKFNGIKEALTFRYVKVGGYTCFSRSIFVGPSSFDHSEFDSDFEAPNSNFQSATTGLNFYSTYVVGAADFSEATFAGPANFTGGSFGSLGVTGKREKYLSMSIVVLDGISVKGDLRIWYARIEQLNARGMRINGSGHFRYVDVRQKANITDSTFDILDLSYSRWKLNEQSELKLQGNSYRDVIASDTEGDSHSALIFIANSADFSPDTYGSLATFFARQGFSDDANRAYVAGKWREWKAHAKWYTFESYSNLLLSLIGWGRYPGRALIPSILTIIFGCFLFRRSNMEERDPKPLISKLHSEAKVSEGKYHAFWYSLELFLPLVSLQSEALWTPKHKHRFLRHYMRIHALLGWVLVPIALAALTGWLK